MQNPLREDVIAQGIEKSNNKNKQGARLIPQPRELGSQHWLSDRKATYIITAIRLLARYNAMPISRLSNPTGRMGFAPRGFETSASFLSIAKAMVYLLFVGRTRRMTQDTASGMHHASACIKLRNDEILARKRDILVFERMIFSHFVSDDIHFLRK